MPQHLELVKNLAFSGVMSSIVSKNDHEQAMAAIRELEMEPYFIFPSIDWTAKGPRIKELISEIGLRSENVLFIDDVLQNLQEASYYSPGLHTLLAAGIPELHEKFDVVGASDPDLVRLQQYKLKEKKFVSKAAFTSNEAFLRDSEIELLVDQDILNNLERAVELVNRTNQLNFTKRRYGASDLSAMIADSNISMGLISCRDKYGDSGIIGFYALDRLENRLLDFTFSCRMMNSGIESYVYKEHLGSPRLDIVQPVSTDLFDQGDVDWISLKEGPIRPSRKSEGISLFFKGGCDLERIVTSLDGRGFSVVSEINTTTPDGVPAHHEHSLFLTQQMALSAAAKEDIIKDWPLLGDEAFSSQIFAKAPPIVIWSLLMDYTQEVYVHTEKGYLIPFGGYDNLLLEGALDYQKKKYPRAIKKIIEFEEYISKNYLHAGKITHKILEKNLQKLLEALPNTIFIFVNGAEITNRPGKEGAAVARHKALNA